MKKPPTIALFEQLPEPAWATDLADGKPEKAAKVMRLAADVGEAFGREAAEQCLGAVAGVAGRAMLRKAERDNPNWDGRTRILAPDDVIVPGEQQ